MTHVLLVYELCVANGLCSRLVRYGKLALRWGSVRDATHRYRLLALGKPSIAFLSEI